MGNKNLYFIIFFSIFSISFFGQNLVEKKADTNNIKEKIIFHIDKGFTIRDVDSVNYHAKKSFYYATQIKNDTLLMESYHLMAHASKIKYNYVLAEENTLKCLKLAKKLDDSYFQFLCYNLLGIVKSNEKQYQFSTEYYNNALSIAKTRHDTVNVSLLYHNIALNYYIIDKPDLAKLFMKKSEDTYWSIKVFEDPFRKDSDFIYVYMKKSLVADSQEEALSYTDMAIERAKKVGLNFHTALAYKYKGRVFSKYNDYNSAIKNFKKTLTYERLANTTSSDSYIELINALIKEKKYNTAKFYLDSLFQHFAYKNIRPIYLDKNKILSDLFLHLGNFNKALFYANNRAEVADSLMKYNNYNLFAEYGKKFETNEKEKEIINQQLVIEKQRNEKKNILLFGSIVFFLGLLTVQRRFKSQKNKKREVENAYEKEYEFNQMRTAFLENISHEIRTPLTLINGYLNLINEEIKDNKKIKGYIKNALSNSKKVIFDADEILNLLKFEDYKMSLKLVPKALNKFLKKIFLSFEVLANNRNIELIYKSKIPDNISTNIDADKVEKILLNLISNAIKFSDSNSKVIFESTIKNTNLEVKVIDFGQGIDVEDQKKIFTRFYQSKNNKSIGGIGIGLLLAKDFAQFLGGNITLESEIGKGSTFIMSIPLSKNKVIKEINEEFSVNGNNTELIQKKEKAVIKTNIAKKPSILIVEDSIEMCNYLKEILTPFYNCTFAFDGLEAIDLAKQQQFELIASDVMMPKVDGYELKKRLKSLPKYTTIPFILITAKTLPEDKIKGFSIGIDDYITKPFKKEELIVRINNLLKNNKELKLSIVNPENLNEDISETYADKLLQKIEKEILDNISDETYKVEDLALKMNYSQRQLARILNRYTGLSSVKFIQEIKLREAYKLIESKKFKTISEVQYQVGITSSSYFSDKFKGRFGITPSELMRK